MRNRYIANVASLLLSAFGLVACGGGGGNTSSPTPEPPPQAVSASDLLKIDPTNAANVAVLSTAYAELAMMFGQMAVDFADRAVTFPASSVKENCPNGGTAEIVFADRDANQRASSGDSFAIKFARCAVPSVDSIVSGAVQITLANPLTTGPLNYSGNIRFGADFVLDGGSASQFVSVVGSLIFDWKVSDFERSLNVQTSAANDFGLAFNLTDPHGKPIKAVESISLAKLTKFTSRETARAFTQIEFGLRSEVMGGTVSVRTTSPLGAYFDTTPDLGALLISGAQSAQLKVEAGSVSTSISAQISLDATGDGVFEFRTDASWSSFTSGYFWWGQGFGRAPSFRQNIDLRGYLPTDFAIISPPISGLSVIARPEFLIQFSRPVSDFAPVAYRFVKQPDPAKGIEWGDEITDAELVARGAVLLIRPKKQLQHGRQYHLFLYDPSTGLRTSRLVVVTDAFGNAITLTDQTFDVVDTLQAKAVVSPVPVLISGNSISIDGSLSSSAKGRVVQYAWRQINGAPLQLSSRTDPTVVLSQTASPAQMQEEVIIELEVSDQQQMIERTRVVINVIPPRAEQNIWYFQSTPGDPIGLGRVRVSSSDIGVFEASSSATGDSLLVRFFPTDRTEAISWELIARSAGGVPLTVGAYENARRAAQAPSLGVALLANDLGCGAPSGRFDIFELERDAMFKISKLAMDFEYRCEESAPPVFGSIRLGSSRPVKL